MKLSSLVALVTGTLLISAAPIAVQATELCQSSNLTVARQDRFVQNRWLNQFGPNVHVVPLCNERPESTLQVLTMSTCATLASFQSEGVRSVSISYIKRKRGAWNAIPRRDQRILEQYDVVVIGEARAVADKIGIIR